MFVKQLGCSPSDKVKVVSIFGNTGDGKSYTLNHTFFHGQEVGVCVRGCNISENLRGKLYCIAIPSKSV